MQIKTGIIGCGQVAYNYHIPILRNLGNAELIAVSDIDKSAMDNIGKVAKYTDFKNMIDSESVDSIHVLTPPQTRLPIVKYAAQNGISVFLEKPTALTTDEVDRLINIRDKHKIDICCTQNMRFLPIMQRAAELIDNDKLGKITAVDNIFSIPTDLSGQGQGQPWADDLPGGALGESIPHPIYTALAFADEMREGPDVNMRQLNTDAHSDGISMTSVDKQNRLVTVRYLTQSHPIRRLTVHGSDGHITVDFLDSTITMKTEDGSSIENTSEGFSQRWGRRILTRVPFLDYSSDSGFSGYTIGHYNLINKYINALESGEDIPVPLEEERDVVAVLEELGS